MGVPKVLIEVCARPTGACMTVGRPGVGHSTRVAGPKPWGGGKIVVGWQVDLDPLIAELEKLRG